MNNIVDIIRSHIKEEYDQTYRNSKTFLQRQSDSKELLCKFSNRVPVIIETHKDVELTKKKFLVPSNVTLAQFFHAIRMKVLNINEGTALFLFTEYDTFPCLSDTMGTLYYQWKNNDGFLYLKCMKERTFG